jgi:uncharacterized protein
MSENKIRYDILASEALRGIIRTVLQRVQKRGLPGEHHFFISFSTSAPGVILSKRLKDQYPDEMMIVLQHTFWDLFVYDDRFEVKLTFNNVPERLVIPFSAIKNFYDPSVQFGFNPNLFSPLGQPVVVDDDFDDDGDATVEVQERSLRPVPEVVADRALDREVPFAESEPPADKAKPADSPSPKVVELDLFRKR